MRLESLAEIFLPQNLHSGIKKQQNSRNWRGCFSLIHERRKISRTGEGGLGFVASKMDATNTKMPMERTNHQTNKLKLVHEQLKNVYKCALPLTTT